MKPQLGAHIEDRGVSFAVWSPKAKTIELVLRSGAGEEQRHAMIADADRIHSVVVASADAGDRYAFRVDGEGPFPDPRSCFQPEGVHGFSEVVDGSAYQWTDAGWRGVDPDHLVVYEVHIGTATPEGTFRALIDGLPYLKELGINVIELMPVAECPGRWNWGYDSVSLYAPNHNYGRPDDFRALVDAAHTHGIGVILDVVYNHLGPEGNYLGVYADDYMSKVHDNSWGKGLNWDGENSEHVRAFAIDNALQWVTEYHLDGFRLDATHAIVDDSPVHLLQELTTAARAAAGERTLFLVAEDERREMVRARPVERGGEGLNAVWADDFHHEARVLLTNAHESYYSLYSGSVDAIATAINNGFGDAGKHRGTPPDAQDKASAFVFCIQNHDQVGNRPFGDRLNHEINADRYHVASTLLLLAPETPLLFMGQEFAASTPFLYFTDHPEELGRLVTEGRRKEFAGFQMFDDPHLRATVPDPQAESTFRASKLDPRDRDRNAATLALYRALITLRRDDPVFTSVDRSLTAAGWLTAQCVVLHRWLGNQHRLVIANFGAAAERELSEFGAHSWTQSFTTGADARVEGATLTIAARTAVVLTATERE